MPDLIATTKLFGGWAPPSPPSSLSGDAPALKLFNFLYKPSLNPSRSMVSSIYRARCIVLLCAGGWGWGMFLRHLRITQ